MIRHATQLTRRIFNSNSISDKLIFLTQLSFNSDKPKNPYVSYWPTQISPYIQILTQISQSIDFQYTIEYDTFCSSNMICLRSKFPDYALERVWDVFGADEKCDKIFADRRQNAMWPKLAKAVGAAGAIEKMSVSMAQITLWSISETSSALASLGNYQVYPYNILE